MNFRKTETHFIMGSRIKRRVLEEPDVAEPALTYLKWQGLPTNFEYCLQKSIWRGRDASWLEIKTALNRKIYFLLNLEFNDECCLVVACYNVLA
jgi:hypothetical protein